MPRLAATTPSSSPDDPGRSPAPSKIAPQAPSPSEFDPANAHPGVFPAQLLREGLDRGWIAGRHVEKQIQPASIDLTLGTKAYRLLCSFLPDRESTVSAKLSEYALEEFSIDDGAILERNRAYLIPLRETLALPETVRARTNPKSSTGRLDIFTRVIVDRHARFDEIPFGYEGEIFLEVVPRSFIVKVASGLSLNQLRLMTGDAGAARLLDSDVAELHMQMPLVLADGKEIPPHDLDLAEGLFLSLDLTPDEHGHVGYRARKNSRVLDLSAVARYGWDEFWEPVATDTERRLMLEPEEFYLLLSRESVSIPPALAAEMSAYDPTAGELRTHYAGFFDPGFGYRESWPQGSRATLEVRARDVPFAIEHGQRICKLIFENLLEPAEMLYGASIGSTYQDQKLTLSKHFVSQGPRGQLLLPDTPAVRSR
jgi:dCTP deaminase